MAGRKLAANSRNRRNREQNEFQHGREIDPSAARNENEQHNSRIAPCEVCCASTCPSGRRCRGVEMQPPLLPAVENNSVQAPGDDAAALPAPTAAEAGSQNHNAPPAPSAVAIATVVPQVPETVAVLRAPIASDSTSKATVPSAPGATETAQAFLTQSEWTVAICRNCVGCDTPRPESCFSKKQWKIGLSRRCKECIKLGRQSISRTKFVPPNLVPECGQVPPEKFHAVEKLEIEKLERQQVLLRRQKKQWFKTDQAVCCPQCRKWMQSPCLCDGLDCANCGGRIWPQFAPEPDEKAAGGTTAEGATATVATTTPLAVARMVVATDPLAVALASPPTHFVSDAWRNVSTKPFAAAQQRGAAAAKTRRNGGGTRKRRDAKMFEQSEYELMRLENIRRNQAFLEQIGLDTPIVPFKPKPKRQKFSSEGPAGFVGPQATAVLPTRASNRLSGRARRSYIFKDEEEDESLLHV